MSYDNGSLRYVSDGTTAIFVAMLFFVIPSRLPKFGSYGYTDAGEVLISTHLTTLTEGALVGGCVVGSRAHDKAFST